MEVMLSSGSISPSRQAQLQERKEYFADKVKTDPVIVCSGNVCPGKEPLPNSLIHCTFFQIRGAGVCMSGAESVSDVHQLLDEVEAFHQSLYAPQPSTTATTSDTTAEDSTTDC